MRNQGLDKIQLFQDILNKGNAHFIKIKKIFNRFHEIQDNYKKNLLQDIISVLVLEKTEEFIKDVVDLVKNDIELTIIDELKLQIIRNYKFFFILPYYQLIFEQILLNLLKFIDAS